MVLVRPRGLVSRLRAIVRATPVLRRSAAWLLLVVAVGRAWTARSSAKAWTNLARAHRHLDHDERSLRAAERGLALAPSSIELTELAADLFVRVGDGEGARRVWANLVAVHTGPMTRRVVLALLQDGHDDLLARYVAGPQSGDDCLGRFSACVASVLIGGPKPPAELALAAQRANDPELSRAAVARLVSVGVPDAAWHVASLTPVPLPTTVRRKLVGSLAVADELDTLATAVQDQAERGTLDRRATAILQDALLERGRAAYQAKAPDMVRWFDAATRLGERRDLLTWSARAHRRAGDLSTARTAVEAALAHSPGWAPALVVHAEILDQAKDPAATDAWHRVVGAEGASRSHLEKACAALTGAGHLEGASFAATRITGLAPEDPDARVLRAVTEFARGDTDLAAAEAAALDRRTDGPSRRALVRLLTRTGDPLRALERLRDIPAEEQLADLWVEVVDALRTHGYLDRASAVSEDALERFPADTRLARRAESCRSELTVVSGGWQADLGARKRLAPERGRVLHVVGRSVPYWRKGYTVRTHHIARAQRQAGLDAQVVTQLGFPWNVGEDVPPLEDIDGVPHHRLRLPERGPDPLYLAERLSLNAAALANLVEHVRPAALHAASDFRNALIALEVGAAFDLPVIYEVRGFWEETWLANRGGVGEDRAWYRLRREREMDAARRATHVVTLAEPMKQHLVANGVPSERISLVPNAVDPAAFREVERDAELARSLALRPDDIVAGYVSSLNRYEGIDVLLEAIAAARLAGIPLRGLVVGDGDDRPRLERLAASLDLDDVVGFTGHVPHEEVAAYYGLIDIFVVPRIDARVCRLVSPLKPYEAMAASRPLAVSRTPVLETIVTDGVTGATFTAGDAADLARTLMELANDSVRRARMGRAAREAVLRDNTWERNAQRYGDIYGRLGIL